MEEFKKILESIHRDIRKAANILCKDTRAIKTAPGGPRTPSEPGCSPLRWLIIGPEEELIQSASRSRGGFR
jgi:hypothetical protein